jgi:LysM repeat protein
LASVPLRSQTASSPLRLTRRGRLVIGVAAAVLATALSLIVAVSAQATSQAPAAPGRSVTQVTVRPGQSLWSVAEVADPNADTRAVVQQIVELNSLTGSAIFAGQRLWVPRG